MFDMAENKDRGLMDDEMNDNIDSVLSNRRRGSTVQSAAAGQKYRQTVPPSREKQPPARQNAGRPAQNAAPAAGHRIQPNYQRWAAQPTSQNGQGNINRASPTPSPSASAGNAAQNAERAKVLEAERARAAEAARIKALEAQRAKALEEQKQKALEAQKAKALEEQRKRALEAKSADAAEDDDVKIAGRKMRRGRDDAATRVTDISDISENVDKRSVSGLFKKKKKGDDDVGGSIVSSLVRTVIYLVTCTVIAVVLSIFIINVGNDVFAFVKSDEAVDVVIPEAATREDIADILYENGVINYKSAFKLYGSLKHIEENFVAGEYTVTPMMNYKDLYSAFKEKPVSGTTWVTIPEGYTFDEIIDLMLDKGIGGSKEEYVKAMNEGDFSEFDFVKELDANGYNENRFYKLEGYLFPDTYEFYNASNAYTVIRKMLKRFDEIYNDKLKARADELGMTTDEVVVLASMIEREAGLSSDFRNVSSVFHNRLNNSATFPYLASDATAVYAIQHDTGERPKHVTAEMMEYDSPYNTYTHTGFPPGAIANPGMNAIKYALYPADTYYYYFVSLSSGETLFATNAAEHEQNVARLRAEQQD